MDDPYRSSGSGRNPSARKPAKAAHAGQSRAADVPKGWDPAPEYSQYEEVPWYRRRFYFMLFWLFFLPAFIIIGFSGDVYASVQGQVVKFKPGNRLMLVIVASVTMTLGFVRLFVLPNR
jgi:hypothetical protein